MILDVRDLGFRYGDKEVLHGISFSADRGSVVSILGPNGVGKTTLLKCMCSLHRPSSGDVFVGGESVSSMTSRERAKHIAYVPQSAIPGAISVFDTVLIGRRPYIQWGATRRDLDITWSAMESMRIDHLSERHTDRISGGEFQKTQISRAVVQEPEILIMDEPTNNLDISNQHVTMHTVIDAVRRRGMCTVMTMHDINLAVHYSDQFIFIKDGTVAASGGPEIITEDLIQRVYGIRADVIHHKDRPFVIPQPDRDVLMHRGLNHARHRVDRPRVDGC